MVWRNRHCPNLWGQVPTGAMFLEDNFTTVSNFFMHVPSNPAIIKLEIHTMEIPLMITQTVRQRLSLNQDLQGEGGGVEKLKCPPIEEQSNKLWCIYTSEYYTVI